jgi:hypothetical protein
MRYSHSKILSTLFITAAAAASAQADPAASDKSRYHLFNPTPRDQMREMSTDRPDLTESPYTVDAGHFQVEMDLVSFTRDRHNPERNDTKVESWTFGNVNLKAGLANNLDLQVIAPVHVTMRTTAAGSVTRNSGFGDITLRLKANLWGNDRGATAFGVMPFLKLPANQDDLGNTAFEGGVILPFAVALPGGWAMGVMAEFDFLEDAIGSGYHIDCIQTITFSHDIVGNLGGYVEFASAITNDDESEWIATVDFGLTYAVTEDIQLDAGVNLGVTRAADDVNPFLGLSWRF